MNLPNAKIIKNGSKCVLNTQTKYWVILPRLPIFAQIKDVWKQLNLPDGSGSISYSQSLH